MQKTILITGAAKRIGAACAKLLHSQGNNLILHYRNSKQQVQALSDDFNQQRANSAHILQADLSSITAVKQLANQATECWGHLDVLINNASDFYPQKMGDVDENNWDQLMNCNLKAPFFLAQALMPTLTKSQGCIINIIDIHAETGLKDYPVYSLAKAGLAAMTKILAKELAPDIRVNGISPGAICWPDNNMSEAEKLDIIDKVALKRVGDADDIAKTVVFLVENAPYVTGQIINVDGGRTLFR
ncbi:MAG: pteridine reductase [Methylococcales bacterium]|nr:pteridine reductase [Methylococcales bacterium]MCK5925507.1 pteridine reductase [Methylococcales bacterium]